MSRIHQKKRVDEAVRVFAKVVEKLPDARLDFYGYGYGNSVEAEVRGLIEAHGLEDRWHFKGLVDEPSEMYEQTCATILTSDSEGFGMVLLESMSYGVPVVAFDSPYGPGEVIVDGTNGYLVERGDHDAFADRLVEIMTDADLRARLGAGALETPSRFRPEIFVDRWQTLLRRVAGKRVASRPPGTRPLLRSAVVVDAMVELELEMPGDLDDCWVVCGEAGHHLTAHVVGGRATFVLKDLPVGQSAIRLRNGEAGVLDVSVKFAPASIMLCPGLALGGGDDDAAYLRRARSLVLARARERVADGLGRLRAKATAHR